MTKELGPAVGAREGGPRELGPESWDRRVRTGELGPERWESWDKELRELGPEVGIREVGELGPRVGTRQLGPKSWDQRAGGVVTRRWDKTIRTGELSWRRLPA